MLMIIGVCPSLKLIVIQKTFNKYENNYKLKVNVNKLIQGLTVAFLTLTDLKKYL